MGFNILTKIDRELLSLDPAFASWRQLKDLRWMRSSINSQQDDNPESYRSTSSFFSNLKDLLYSLIDPWEIKEERGSRPKMASPIHNFKEKSYLPPRYFSKGAHQSEPSSPIPYLLIETSEVSKGRPVPGNSLFLRSIAKGKGILKKNSRGLFYLDIDNRFIMSLIPYLKAYGLVRPPYFNLFGTSEGAHIPVISPQEAAFHFIETLSEIDKEFSFEIEGLYSIEPTLWPEMEQVWFFKVRSLELAALRKRNFLIAQPAGHSFQIAVAVKPHLTQSKEVRPLPNMRINVACLSA
jgi:hypothetical protein